MKKVQRLIEYLYSKFINTQVFLIRFVFNLIFNFRLIGLLSLILIALSSLFKWKNAELTNEILILCGMIFLCSVFSELKSWNLWGFKGESKQLSDIPENGGIDTDKKKPSPDEVDKAETKRIQLMRYDKGNFLELAFEIERLLRVLATVTLARDIPSNVNADKLVDELHKVGMVTNLGKQQIEAIRWLRNLLVHGRDSEINQQILNDGIRIAYSFYTELYNWLNTPQNT